MFSYLSKVLFSGFLQFKGNFGDGRNNSKHRDLAPLSSRILFKLIEIECFIIRNFVKKTTTTVETIPLNPPKVILVHGLTMSEWPLDTNLCVSADVTEPKMNYLLMQQRETVLRN